MTDYVRIPIREEEHAELLRLQGQLTGKIKSYLTRPSLSDVIRYLLDQQESTMNQQLIETDYDCDRCNREFVGVAMSEEEAAHRQVVCSACANELLAEMDGEEFHRMYVSP